MTATAWPGPTHPTGPAGPGPSGPAGPNGPQPSSPPQPAPTPSPAAGTGSPWPSRPGPSNPGGPTGPGRLAAELDTASLLLRSIGILRLSGMDPADRAQLDLLLRSARRVVAGALNSATAEKLRRSARAEVGAAAVAGRAGGPPAPGAGFDLPKAPGTQALMASLARRAD